LTDFHIKTPVLNFMDIRLGVTGLIYTDGQTDKANLLDGLRDYVTGPKNVVTKCMWIPFTVTSLHYIIRFHYLSLRSPSPQNTALVHSEMFMKIHVKYCDHSEETETSFCLRLTRTNTLLRAAAYIRQ
jgi:hypothetical protein